MRQEVFEWLRKWIVVQSRPSGPNHWIGKAEPDSTMIYNTRAEIEGDGTIRIRVAINLPQSHTDGIQTISPGDPEYDFWCWLVNPSRSRGLLTHEELDLARYEFCRITGGTYLNESPKESPTEDNLQRPTESIISAFHKTLERATDRILDARMLPHSKADIREAFDAIIRVLEVRCNGDNDDKECWMTELKLCRATRLRVSDFQDIDETDESVVQLANAGCLDERKTLLLFLKYHQRAMKEDGLSVENPLEQGVARISFAALCARLGI